VQDLDDICRRPVAHRIGAALEMVGTDVKHDAAATVASTSEVLASRRSSASATPGAFGFASLTTTWSPMDFATWMPGSASPPPLTISNARLKSKARRLR
jgi:hypothetical protein